MKGEGIAKRLENLTKVNPATGCLEFTGGKWNGYGQFYIGNDKHLAHRVSWKLHNGEIPKGMCVLHKCDNPVCCNIDHLFLGTKGDNAADRAQKKRSATGKHPYGVWPVRQKKTNTFRYRASFAWPGAGSCGNRYLATYDTMEQAAAVSVFARDVAYGVIGMM